MTQLAAQGRTVVVATHDVDFARTCAHRVVMLDEGCIVAEGSPELVLAARGFTARGADREGPPRIE